MVGLCVAPRHCEGRVFVVAWCFSAQLKRAFHVPVAGASLTRYPSNVLHSLSR